MSASHASSAASKPARLRAAAARCAATLGVALVALLAAPLAQAQDWGDDSSEDWSSPQPAQQSPRTTSSSASRSRNPAAGWSVQGGIGFTADPDTFLMNFEAPYAFNRWFSFGPAMQVGINNHNRTLVAPTGNLRVTIPDMPGRSFDRVHPYAIAGMGFAVIDDERNGNDNSAATGFLIDFGAGVEYQVSEKVFLGTQMIFNVLPDEVKGEHFYFAWQLGGIRFAF